MHKIITALLLLGCLVSTRSQAQNKATVKGIVADSLNKIPLEFATVAIVNAKDTALISYTLTDKTGAFKLGGIPSDRPTRLIVSYIGFNTFRQNLQLQPGETKDFGQILISGKSLSEVVIKGERSPVVVKKDTTEFNAENFKTRVNASVEELLRKLPGLQVNNDGSILFNGRDISKLLIDGKQFFGSDPKVATRNLDADMIDKIQVYDDRENDPDHKLSDSETSKIINLKMKSKIKKSTLGKIHGGAGSRDRYEAGGIISNFRDTLQVSLIGMANNLNSTGFSTNELYSMGGFNRSGGEQIWDGTFGNSWRNGIEALKSGGVNINNNYGEKLKLNLAYFYTNSTRTNTGNNFNEQTLTDTKLTSASSFNSTEESQKHAIGGLIEWVPDTIKRFRYEPKLGFNPLKNTYTNAGSTFNTQTPKLNESKGNNNDNSSNNSFSHQVTYYHRLKKKGESITLRHSLSLNENIADNYAINNLTSFTSSINSELRDRYSDKDWKQSSGDFSLNYNYPFTKKLSGEVTSLSKYSKTSDYLLTYDKNTQSGLYDLFLDNQSTSLVRSIFIQNLQPQLNYRFSDKLTVKAGVRAEIQNVRNKFNTTIPDIYNQYLNLFPMLNINGNSYSISYSQDIEQPQISQMQPIVREYSQLYKSVGNPDLQPSRVHSINGNYYKYNYAKQLNLNVYGNLSISDNNVIQKTTIESNNARTSTSVNRDGGVRAYFGGNFGKQFKKSQNWQIALRTNASGNYNRRAFFLNADEGVQYNYSLTLGQSINFNYNELITLNAKYDFSNNLTQYKEVDFKDISTNRHTITGDVSLRWPKRIILDGRYSFNYNPQIGQGFQKSSNIINLAISVLMLKKDRGQLKLSVYDLLDENVSVFRYAGNNSVNISDQSILKRYFLLNYQYKISVFKGK